MSGDVERRDAAIAYAGMGWHVIPLWWPTADGCACGDRECDSPGKHPHGRLSPHGLGDASDDPQIVAGWFDAVPELNVGLRTGIGFDVLDLDRPEAGRWLAERGVEAGADTSECWGWGPMSITGHGHHLLYAVTGAGNRTRMAGQAGLDWRGKNGYIVAPPSRHPSGHVYRWHDDCPASTPIPEAPEFLVDIVLRRAKPPEGNSALPRPMAASPHGGSAPGRWSAAGLVSRVALAVEGERNSMLNWAALKVGADVRAGKVTDAEAVQALEQLAVAAERAGLGGTEIDKTIRSGFGAGREGRAA